MNGITQSSSKPFWAIITHNAELECLFKYSSMYWDQYLSQVLLMSFFKKGLELQYWLINHVDNFDGMAVVPKFKANGLKFQQVADGTFTLQYFINELVSNPEWYCILMFVISYQLQMQKKLEHNLLHFNSPVPHLVNAVNPFMTEAVII